MTTPDTSRPASPMNTPSRGAKRAGLTPKKSTTSTPGRVDQRYLDLSGLNLNPKDEFSQPAEEPPKMTITRDKLLEDVKGTLEAQNEKKGVSLVVIGTLNQVSTKGHVFDAGTLGHVDAGKSTLMGRLLYELGRVDEKTRTANERGSSKIGKSSFSWAWELDGTAEERER